MPSGTSGLAMDLNAFRQQIPFEEFNYQTLTDALKGYSSPRDKISTLLRQGAIVRIKKGLYVFGELYRRRPLCRELLANLIYGPSYVSLEYAMSYHGMIPEHIETITSVTCGRSRDFDTPIGRFAYRSIPAWAMRSGMDQVVLKDGRSFLIAVPEKALADALISHRGIGTRNQKDLYSYLTTNQRISPDVLEALDEKRLDAIADGYRSRKLATLSSLIRRLRAGRA